MALDSDLRGDEKKHRFWNTAPFDPIEGAHKAGYVHKARVLHGVLMSQSLMPVGQYRGRIMTAVPAWFLLHVHKSWWGTKPKWAAVRDYTDRHLAEITERFEKEEAKRKADQPPPDNCP